MTAITPTLGYLPQHKQGIAHSCPAEDMFYGGALGGGKSDELVNDGIYHCAGNAQAEGLLLRREWKELRKLIRRSHQLLDPWPTVARYDKGEHIWHFSNGSLLTFGNAQHEDDIEKYTGDEYSWIGIDEGPTFTDYQLRYIRSRNRSSKGIWTVFRSTGNPKGVSFWEFRNKYVVPEDRDAELIAWFDEDAAVRDGEPVLDYGRYWRFYEEGTRGNPAELIDQGKGLILVWRPNPTPAMEKRNKFRRERGDPELKMPSRCFIFSRIQDNKYLYDDMQYERNLAATLGEDLADALLEGSWDRFEGQAFPEFKIDRHVIEPISIPEHWSSRVWGGFDWGWRDPLCHLWLVTDPATKQIIVYRELYEDHLQDSVACQLIREMTQWPERLRFSNSDPSMWRDDSSDVALSKARIYRMNGVHLDRGNNDRVPGWSRLHDLLALDPISGKPKLVISSNCTNLIRELQAAVVDENKPEDVDPDCSDHALDALRYACMSQKSSMREYGRPRAGRVVLTH